jgi:sugar transferase (PEP-CTERM system associated)
VLTVDATLVELARRHAINEIVTALDDRRNVLPDEDILQCKRRGINIIDDTTLYERQLGKISLDSLRPDNIFCSDEFSQALASASSSGKRLFDIVVSGLMLIAALPIMLLTAVTILFVSGGRGTVIYRQVRVGRNGEPFEMYKFRSMCEDAESDGTAQWAAVNDDRVTRVGKFIRATRIDELPQFFNVLLGDMSFVGPRPERTHFVNQLQGVIPYYALRHNVKPGITGWAQICYHYGASVADAREKLQYDLYYLKNYSIFLDLMILIQTVQVILWRKGSR